MINDQILEQVGINRVLFVLLACVTLAIDGLPSDEFHQPFDALTIDLMTQLSQPGGKSPYPVKRRFIVLLIDQSHQVKVLFTFRHRSIIQAAAMDPEQLTLAALAYIDPFIDHRSS